MEKEKKRKIPIKIFTEINHIIKLQLLQCKKINKSINIILKVFFIDLNKLKIKVLINKNLIKKYSNNKIGANSLKICKHN